MGIWLWIGFLLLIGMMLAVDLGLVNRRDHVLSVHEALGWTAFWVALALVFNVVLYFIYQNQWLGMGADISGRQAAVQFFTGFVVEKSLSLDNIFVIALIFSHFRIPLQYQHRVLYWGIFGAVFLRGGMILAGAALISRLSWMVYVFGGLLLFTAVRMLIIRHDNVEPQENVLVKWVRRRFAYAADYAGRDFFILRDGQRIMTPLFLCLLMIESMDVLFAVDSIPAILGITQDAFIVFTSNIFAILGLRSLYFALAALMEKLRHLKTSLVFILAFIGVKMVLSHHWHIPATVSLAIILGILLVGVAASLCAGGKDPVPLQSPVDAGERPELCRLTDRRLKRVLILILGTSVLMVGVLMLVLPGPGVLVTILGLTLLAGEAAWARVVLKRFKKEADSYSGKLSALLTLRRKKK